MADCANLPQWQLDDVVLPGQAYNLGRYLNGDTINIQLLATAQAIGQGCLLDTSIANSSVTSVTVLSQGEGYAASTTRIAFIPNTPNSPMAVTATATPLIDINGRIYSVNVNNSGSGYTSAPSAVVIDTSSITYSLIGGELPNSPVSAPVTVSSSGLITGTLAAVTDDTTSTFVVRATDSLGNYRDQTFSITVYALNAPTINVRPNGFIAVVTDSTWTNSAISYTNPNPLLPVTFRVSSDGLPEGLWLTSEGVINGYARDPGYTYLETQYLIAESVLSTPSQGIGRITLSGNAVGTFVSGNFIALGPSTDKVLRISFTDPSMADPEGNPFPGVWYNSTTNKTTVVLTSNQIASVTENQPTYTVNAYRDFNVSITATNRAGSDTKNVKIRVNNQATTPNLVPLRLPVILNSQPLTPEIPLTDEFYAFYLPDTTDIGSFKQDGFFAFKFIGYDFNAFSVSYQIAGIEQLSDLSFDEQSGWLTGILPNLGNETRIYRINVRAVSTDQLGVSVLGPWFTFRFTVTGDVSALIEWQSPANLATIDNGSISNLSVVATNPSDLRIKYLLSGTYPVTITSSAYFRVELLLLVTGYSYEYSNGNSLPSNRTRLVVGVLPQINPGMLVLDGMGILIGTIVGTDIPTTGSAGIIIDQQVTTTGSITCRLDILSLSGYSGTILTSNNGGEFLPQNTNNFNDITGIAAQGGSNFAVNPGMVAIDSGGRILNSNDGEVWVYNNQILPASATKIRYFDIGIDYSGFYIVGNPYPLNNSFLGMIRFSTNGSIWQDLETEPSSLGGYVLRDIVATSTKIVMVGDSFVDINGVAKAVVYQADQARPQVIFELVNINSSANLTGVAVGTVGATTVFMAVGDNGTVYTSADAETWTLRSISNFVEDLTGVVFDGTRFVLVGNNGAIVTATLALSPAFSVIDAGYAYNFTSIDYYSAAVVPSTSAIGYVITADNGIALTGTNLNNLSNPLAPQLPPNLSLLPTGEIAGRVAFETQSTLTVQGSTIPFTFTVQASSLEYPAITNSRQFTVNVRQRWNQPYETLYFKAYPPLEDRAKLRDLLENTGVIAAEITYGGAGYAEPPLVTITPPGLATGFCSINDRSQVRSISVIDPGYDYSSTSPPAVTIAPPSQSAILWSPNLVVTIGDVLYYLDTTAQQTNFYRVTAVSPPDSVARTGSTAPTFTFGAQLNGTVELLYIGTQAQAAVSVDATTGSITNAVITNPGFGYTSAPQITFQEPPNAETATAVASVVLGAVTQIIITNAGTGYRSEPQITIAASPLGAASTATAVSVMYMPDDILYRPADSYFGKATAVVYQHQFGVNASSYQTYINSVDKNFYKRRLLLGELQTAVAKNSLGEVVYEVVYSEIQDDLTLNGVSVRKQIRYPITIMIGGTFYYVSSTSILTNYGIVPRYQPGYTIRITNNSNIFSIMNSKPNLLNFISVGDYISPKNFMASAVMSLPPEILDIITDTRIATYDPVTGTGTLSRTYSGLTMSPVDLDVVIGEKVYYTALTPLFTNTVYPASLVNMRRQISDTIGNNPDSSLLPLWMTSQQANGSELGFVPAWVICYTRPGFSAEVKRTIEAYYPHTLNSIDFQLDRFEVDRSATYDWTQTSANARPNGTWDSNLPSAVPVPQPIDSEDWFVFFPQKTILPQNQ